jgi:hypothetical protein
MSNTHLDKFIIFQNDSGGVAVMQPIDLQGMDILTFAINQVPKGKKFKIVHQSEMPTDRTLRNEWTVDEAQLTDGIGKG